MKMYRFLLTVGVAIVIVGALAQPASATELTFGVATSNIKVRPDMPAPDLSSSAQLMAARNEFEAFQVVFIASGGAAADLSMRLTGPLTGPQGATIATTNVNLYREAYYYVRVASNTEGASGRWPDALIPDVDEIVGEKRNAFPFEVPDGENRVIWVDVFAPADATPGDYTGSLEVLQGSNVIGTVGIALRVGTFAIPSTATLRTAFGFDYAQPCLAHTGVDDCDPNGWNEPKALELRERYLRLALDHRFSLDNPFFQPPTSAASVEAIRTSVLPLVQGTGNTRLRGARLTAIRVWGPAFDTYFAYAKAQGFFDRVYYYPVDEPPSGGSFEKFGSEADALHAVDPDAKIILTSDIKSTDEHGVTDKVDIFCPVINYLDLHPDQGVAGDGYLRPLYDDWLASNPRHEMWSYQACMSHGCGDCGMESPLAIDTGWPSRVIDSSAVQDRAFPWIAFAFDITGELYFNAVEQFNTAWDEDGQCKFSGSGDGTILYPGKPSIIGGTTDIPVASIRVKMIREGMEDYEYLVLTARTDAAKAKSTVSALFPHAYECAQPPLKLENARAELFRALDANPPPDPTDGGGGQSVDVQQPPAADGGGSSSSSSSSSSGSSSSNLAAEEGVAMHGSCSVSGNRTNGGFGLLLLALLGLAQRRRLSVARPTAIANHRRSDS